MPARQMGIKKYSYLFGVLRHFKDIGDGNTGLGTQFGVGPLFGVPCETLFFLKSVYIVFHTDRYSKGSGRGAPTHSTQARTDLV